MQSKRQYPPPCEPCSLSANGGALVYCGGVKLIAMIGSRSDPQAAYREVTVEADDYETAFKQARESLAEDGRLLSVRMP